MATALIAVGGLAGMTSVLLVLFLSQARIFMAMARDGLLPGIFGTVHPRFRTPHIATMVTGAVICLTAALTPIKKLEEMVNVGTLMAFVMVCAAVLLLRRQRPNAKRPFRCRWSGWFRPHAAATCRGLGCRAHEGDRGRARRCHRGCRPVRSAHRAIDLRGRDRIHRDAERDNAHGTWIEQHGPPTRLRKTAQLLLRLAAPRDTKDRDTKDRDTKDRDTQGSGPHI